MLMVMFPLGVFYKSEGSFHIDTQKSMFGVSVDAEKLHVAVLLLTVDSYDD